MSWIPITSKIVDSSLWDEQDWIVKIFLTMLVGKGKGDVYRENAYTLARASRKSEAEVLEAWKVLSSPDTKRMEAQEHDGRRIQAVEDGWLILNAEKYRKQMSEELKKFRNRKAQQRWRELHRGPSLPGEQAYQKAVEAGDERLAESIVEQHLPAQSSNGNGQSPQPKPHTKSFVLVPGEGLRKQ